MVTVRRKPVDLNPSIAENDTRHESKQVLYRLANV